MESGSSFGRMIVLWLIRPWTFFVFLGVIGVIFLYFMVDHARQEKRVKKFPFQAKTNPKHSETVFLFCPGAKDTTTFLVPLRGFSSAEEIYDYLYKKFDEPAFQNVRIYRANSTESEAFDHSPEQSDADNLERLRQLLG
nr:hypothetical protein [Armatimonas sp.]